MGSTGGTEGSPPAPGRRGRRPRRPAVDSANGDGSRLGTSAAADPPPAADRRAVRADIVLHRGAYATVRAEMDRRGTGISATIDSLIHEWQLLRRIQDAQRFRHDTKGDLNAIALNAQVIATVPPGRQRDEALTIVKERAQAVKDRLVLVTVLKRRGLAGWISFGHGSTKSWTAEGCGRRPPTA